MRFAHFTSSDFGESIAVALDWVAFVRPHTICNEPHGTVISFGGGEECDYVIVRESFSNVMNTLENI